MLCSLYIIKTLRSEAYFHVTVNMTLEDSLEALGRYGRWQVITFILVNTITHFPGVAHFYAIIFIGHANPYHCLGKEDAYHLNDSTTADDSALNRSVPYEYNAYGDLLPARCHQYANSTLYGANKTEACTRWYIDPDGYEPDRGTMFMEWNLVCDKEYYMMLSQTLFLVGVLFGFCFLGPVNDYFGRKPMCFYCLLLCNVTGLAKAFVISFEWLCIIQLVNGLFASNLYLCGFVMSCEINPSSIRSIVATGSYLFESTAIIILSVMAYFIRDWRMLQFAVTIICFPFLLYYWWCPESPRWLMANGRVEETQRWIDTAARCNKVTVSPHILTKKSDNVEADTLPSGKAGNGDEEITLWKYLSHCKLLMYTLIQLYLWNVLALMSFGISYMSAAFAGNHYVNLGLIGIMESGGLIASTYTSQKFGRRYPLMIFHFLAFLFLGISAAIDYFREIGGSVEYVATAFAVLGKFTLSTSSCSMSVIAPELFPTAIRSAATGQMFGLGFIGGIAAPLTLYVVRQIYTCN